MRSLTGRLIFTSILTIMLSLMIAMFITFKLIPNHLANEIQEAANDIAQSIEEQQIDNNTALNTIQAFSIARMEFISLEELQKSRNVTEEMKESLLKGQTLSSHESIKRFYYVYPLQIHGEQRYLQISFDQTIYEEFLKRAFILLTAITLIVGILINVFTSVQIVRPIKRLTHYTKRIAKGHFEIPTYKKRTKDIDQLYESFGKMSIDLEKMLQSQKDFVSNISHEFQTPLTSINGFAKAIQHKEMNREQQQRYLQIIEQESARLSQLSRNVLKLSSLQNDTEPLEKRSFNLAEQIRNVIISLEPQWAAKSLQFDLQLEKSVIHADEMLLYQVWYNIINNAISFSPIEGTISIKVWHEENNYFISIEDEGPGIDPSELERVKEPFYKAKTHASKGNGLGLSIVEKIVYKHMGKVILERGNVGLRVFIQLPK